MRTQVHPSGFPSNRAGMLPVRCAATGFNASVSNPRRRPHEPRSSGDSRGFRQNRGMVSVTVHDLPLRSSPSVDVSDSNSHRTFGASIDTHGSLFNPHRVCDIIAHLYKVMLGYQDST